MNYFACFVACVCCFSYVCGVFRYVVSDAFVFVVCRFLMCLFMFVFIVLFV